MEDSIPSIPKAQFVGFGRRLLAYLVDGMVLLIIDMAVGFSFGINVFNTTANSETSTTMVNLALPLQFIVNIGYFVLFWVKQDGQTLGNRLLAIKVVKEDGKGMDMGTAIIRYIGYLISSFPLFLGFLWIIWDKNKQGWHDKIAKTHVVRTEAKGHVVLASLIVLIFPSIFGLLLVIGLGAGILAYKQNPSIFKNFYSKESQSKTSLPTDTFLKVNEYRQNNNLQVLEEDLKLCAYAQRRLEQLAQFGKWDDYKGFYEDTANNDIWNAYFNDYSGVNETGYTAYSSTTSDKVIDWWTKQENPLMKKAEYTHGCIRTDESNLVFILGVHK